ACETALGVKRRQVERGARGHRFAGHRTVGRYTADRRTAIHRNNGHQAVRRSRRNTMNFHRLVLRNLQRNGMQSLLTTLGILLGVSVWLFFAGLSTGIQENVLRHIVSERFVEVVPRSVQIAGVQRSGGLFGGSVSGLDTYPEQDLRAIEGVVATYPKQQLSFPATVRGGKSILGEDVWAAHVADGIDPALVELSKDNPRNAFVDWAAIEDCTSDATCGDGAVCTAGTCERKACSEPSMCPE